MPECANSCRPHGNLKPSYEGSRVLLKRYLHNPRRDNVYQYRVRRHVDRRQAADYVGAGDAIQDSYPDTVRLVVDIDQRDSARRQGTQYCTPKGAKLGEVERGRSHSHSREHGVQIAWKATWRRRLKKRSQLFARFVANLSILQVYRQHPCFIEEEAAEAGDSLSERFELIVQSEHLLRAEHRPGMDSPIIGQFRPSTGWRRPVAARRYHPHPPDHKNVTKSSSNRAHVHPSP
jgi:hypothetical protein